MKRDNLISDVIPLRNSRFFIALPPIKRVRSCVSSDRVSLAVLLSSSLFHLRYLRLGLERRTEKSETVLRVTRSRSRLGRPTRGERSLTPQKSKEVLGLKWSAIDLDEGVMTIRHTAVQLRGATLYQDATKSKASRRSFPILGRMKEYLKALKYHQEVMRIEYGSEYISNDYVCKWDNGKPMRPDTLSNKFRRLIEENNLPPLTFHGLRHSCASILLSQGCSLKQIQDWLGHEDIQTTADIYSHRILISNRNRQQKYERKATLLGRREGFLSARLFEINMIYRSKTGIADILDRSISKNPHNHQENQTF